MSDELNQAVPETSNEAVPPVRAVDSGDPELLQRKLDLVQQDSRAKGETNKALKKELEDMRRQMADLQNSQQKAKQAQLAESGEFKTLWQEATGTVSSLQEELAARDKMIQELKVASQQQQIKATAINAFTQQGVNAPDHLMKILGDNLRLDSNGNVIALHGGVEVDLNTHLTNLKQPGSGFEMFFNGTQARGMSASGSSSTTAGGKSWSSLSFTEKVMLEEQDRVRGTNEVARLKAAG